jgi:hypothetical protein
MPEYRVYKFNAAGHIFEPPQVIQSDDDQEVIGKARQLVNGHAIEVLEAARLIVCLPDSMGSIRPPPRTAAWF